jgi:hypothetical protein
MISIETADDDTAQLKNPHHDECGPVNIVPRGKVDVTDDPLIKRNNYQCHGQNGCEKIKWLSRQLLGESCQPILFAIHRIHSIAIIIQEKGSAIPMIAQGLAKSKENIILMWEIIIFIPRFMCRHVSLV